MIFNKRNALILVALMYASLPLSLSGQGDPRVTTVFPMHQSMSPSTKPEIIIGFNSPVDPVSVDLQSMKVLGRWTGVCPGQILFEDDNQQIRFVPAKAFSAGEWLTVSLSKNIRSASGENMTKGYAWNFWTASNPGLLDLQEVRVINVRQDGEKRIRSYGAYAGDLNGDGFHDFTVPNEDSHDIRIFLNDRTGNYDSFTVYKLFNNPKPSTNEGADFNGDGMLDFAVGNILGNSVSVLFGDGTGKLLPPTTYPVGVETRGLGVLDLNGDGAPDIVTANRASSNISLLLNKGDGTFAKSKQVETGADGETSIAVADANEDGIMDVFVGSFKSREIVLMLGDGDGNLSVAAKTDVKGVAWMLAVGDVDNDGHVDVVAANAVQNQFALLRGDGHGNLSPPEAYNTGGFPLAIDLGDLDGDGDLDVVTSNFNSANWTIYENDGAGNFINRRTLTTSRAGSCAVLHDRDQDGDLDMTGIDELDDLLILFENPGTTTIGNNPHDHTSIQGPIGFELLQSYPNPFHKNLGNNPNRMSHIIIPFNLNQNTSVKLELLNLKGQRVALLINSEFPAGQHSSGLTLQDYPAGIYFYRLTSTLGSMTRKILVLP